MTYQNVSNVGAYPVKMLGTRPPREKVLITGANGFIGSHLSSYLIGKGYRVRRMVRSPDSLSPVASDDNSELVRGDLLDEASLTGACEGVSMLVHCAGHAHAFGEAVAVAERINMQINHEATRTLARIAGQSGVEHFVFLSSVKAMGDPGDECVDENWSVLPTTPYGWSKRAAEAAALEEGAHSGMKVTNLRLAMVYGPGSRGNLERMLQGVKAGWFPPLPKTGKRRSLIHVHDVVYAIEAVLTGARANGKTYIITHPQAVTAAELYDAMRDAVGKAPARWRVPADLVNLAGHVGDTLTRLTGRPMPFDSAVVARLLDGACFRADRIQRDLGWVAQVGLREGLATILTASASAQAFESVESRPLE